MRTAPVLATVVLLALGGGAGAHVPDNKIEIGVLDEGGGDAADTTETGALTAVAMAAEEFGRYPGPLDVETLHAVHDAEPSHDLATVRDWLDHEHLAFLVDLAPRGGATDAALARLLASRGRLLVLAGPAIDARPPLCGPEVLRWGTSPYGLDRAVASDLAAHGHRRIALVTAADPASAALATDMGAAAAASGLSIVDTEALPRGSRDQRPAVIAARRSGADATVLLLDGDDLRGTIATEASFGTTLAGALVAPAATVTDVAAVGLGASSGLLLPGEFDMRADRDSARFVRLFTGRGLDRAPRDDEADSYVAVLAVLDAIRRDDSIDARRIMATLTRDGADDPFDGHVAIRGDGWAMRPIHMFTVRRPVDAGLNNDLLSSTGVIPAGTVAPPLCAPSERRAAGGENRADNAETRTPTSGAP